LNKEEEEEEEEGKRNKGLYIEGGREGGKESCENE